MPASDMEADEDEPAGDAPDAGADSTTMTSMTLTQQHK